MAKSGQTVQADILKDQRIGMGFSKPASTPPWIFPFRRAAHGADRPTRPLVESPPTVFSAEGAYGRGGQRDLPKSILLSSREGGLPRMAGWCSRRWHRAGGWRQSRSRGVAMIRSATVPDQSPPLMGGGGWVHR